MARPSIFSKEYERHKKRRKRFVAFSVVLIFAAAGILFYSGNIKNILAKKADAYRNIKIFSIFQKEKKNETAPSIAENKLAPETQPAAPSPVKQEDEKGYDILLSDGTKVKAVYVSTDSGNKFKYILPLDSQATFNINPSGNAMVVMDTAAQNMFVVDINGNVQDITNKSYSYKAGVIRKDSTIARLKNHNYVWCATPKFIDDDNIAYLSQLPQAKSTVTTKYFWYVNIKNKDNHIPKTSIKGENLKLGNLTDKGLEVILDDGTAKFVKVADGDINLSQQ